MSLPKQRLVVPFHSLPGVHLLCTSRNLLQVPCHSHQLLWDVSMTTEDMLHASAWAAEGTRAGSALQNQQQIRTSVQVGNARWGCLHPNCLPCEKHWFCWG